MEGRQRQAQDGRPRKNTPDKKTPEEERHDDNLRNKLKNMLLIRWLIYLLIFYFATTVYLYLFADFYIFYPPSATYQLSANDLTLKTEDGATIAALYLPNKHATYTVLFSHGNREDLGRLLPFLRKLHSGGFAVFAYDYHGYGGSTGRATERNAYRDINAAYHYLTTQLHIPPHHIITFGRSLGAAVSIDLAAREPIGGLIIESPFLTAFRTMTQIPLFIFDKFDNLTKIKRVKCPVLVIHGKHDYVVPFWQGEKLYEVITAPKLSLFIPDAGHNDVAIQGGDAYWEAIRQFRQHFLRGK